jgi:hypothetical protein
MQNPPEKTYTVEELFTLAPETAEPVFVSAEPAIVPAPIPQSDVLPELPKEIGFWSKNKWYFIIGGVICIGGVAWYLHAQSKKKKKKSQQN